MNEQQELQALNSYFEEHKPDLLIYARELTNGNEEDAKALLLQTYDCASYNIKNCPLDQTKMGDWLQGIMRNQKKSLDYGRYFEANNKNLLKHAKMLAHGSEEVAEELLQQASAQYLHTVMEENAQEIGNLGGWLYITMKHIQSNINRRVARDRRNLSAQSDEELDMLEDDEDEQPEKVLMNAASEDEIQTILSRLAPKDKKTMSLYFEGLNWAEIAERLGEKPETVNSRRKRCRPKLLGLFSAKQLKYFLDKSPNSRRRMEKTLMLSPFTPLESLVMSLYVLQGFDFFEIAEMLSESYKAVESIVKKCKPILFESFYKKAEK